MNLSLDTLWKLGGLLVVAVALYYRVDYLEKEVASLREELKETKHDLKFTSNSLMRFQYGEYAVD